MVVYVRDFRYVESQYSLIILFWVDTRTSDGGVICWIRNLLKACRGPYSQGTTSKIWYTYQRKLKCVKMQIVIFRIDYLLVVHSYLLILLEFIRLSYV